MNVRFDGQIFSLQSRGGISRYVIELAAALERDPGCGVEVHLPRLLTPNEHLLARQGGRGRLPALSLRVPGLVAGLNAWRPVPRCDVVHHTYYGPGALGRKRRGERSVVTVYDMAPERFPELFPRGNPHLSKERYVEQADLVLCISEATKRDLIDIYGPPDAPVVVTPLAASLEDSRPVRAPESSSPYVLYVGARHTYKDFPVALRALAACHPSLELLAVGGGPLGPDEQRSIADLGLSGRVRQRNLDDDGLVAAYRGAICLVFPSRYEGFGLPVLEAMSLGCPAVVARVGSLPEVGGEAALYFPGQDHDALAAEVTRLLEDPDIREGVRTAGRKRAGEFSWQRTADLTARAYRSLSD